MKVTLDGPPPRDALVALIAEEFPDWRVVPVERATDDLDRPMVMIKQRTIAVLPASPISHYVVGFYVTLVDEHRDPTLAEPALDANVLALWSVLQATKNINPKQATKVSFDPQHMAYDIETDLWIGITKEQS